MSDKSRMWLVQYQLLHNGNWWTYAGKPLTGLQIQNTIADTLGDPSIQNVRIVEYVGQPIEQVV